MLRLFFGTRWPLLAALHPFVARLDALVVTLQPLRAMLYAGAAILCEGSRWCSCSWSWSWSGSEVGGRRSEVGSRKSEVGSPRSVNAARRGARAPITSLSHSA